jgi:hypothetical protein
MSAQTQQESGAATHAVNVHVVGWAPHYTMAFVCLKHENKLGKHVQNPKNMFKPCFTP